MLYIALDRKYINEEEFYRVFDVSVSCSQLIWGFIKSLRKHIDWKASIVVVALLLSSSILAYTRF